MQLIISEAYDNLNAVKRLLDCYVREFNLDLGFQHYDEEYESLASKYARPDGGLYLAYVDGSPVGCAAFYMLKDGTAEMKRLYVDKAYRGCGCGKALAETTISEAQLRGYSLMVLDTLSTMECAVHLYKRLGFTETAPYYHNPIPTVLFFEKHL